MPGIPAGIVRKGEVGVVGRAPALGPRSRWAARAGERWDTNVVAVALANKNAGAVCAVLAHATSFDVDC